MTARTFYRLSLWIPIALPGAGAFVVHGLGVPAAELPLGKLVQLMLVSLVYGGIPYALLALWASWWVGRRSEDEIRRRAMVAPLLMIAVWIPFAMLPSILAGKVEMFFGLVALGAVCAIVLGYGYVALVLALRAGLGRAGWIAEPAPSSPAPSGAQPQVAAEAHALRRGSTPR